jgi:predicted nucleotidyltransferase
MSRDTDSNNQPDEGDLILGRALRVLNSLESEGVIGRYAIGGAVGLIFYIEPLDTDDLDIFCHMPQTTILIDLNPLYRHLAKSGYEADGECISIEGIPVQFLVPPTKLTEEALDNAVECPIEGVPTRVFQYEHLLAIMAETGRPRDRAKLAVALDSREPDDVKLKDILKRHNLLAKWKAMSS